MLYPPAGQGVNLVALDNSIFGTDSHWYDGRAFPCFGIDLDCEGCKHGQVARWYGYLPSLWLPSKTKVLACISEGAFRECLKLQSLNGSLRGWQYRLERMGQGKTAPVRCVITGPRHGEPLPPSWDIRAALMTLWRVDSLPKSLQREPSADGPPPDRQA